MNRLLVFTTLLFATLATWLFFSSMGNSAGPTFSLPREYVEASARDNLDKPLQELRVSRIRREGSNGVRTEENSTGTEELEAESHEPSVDKPLPPPDSDFLAYAEALVPRDDFINLLVNNQSPFSMPAETIVTGGTADRLHEATTHVIARLLRNYAPDVMSAYTENQQDAMRRFAVGSSILQSILPDLATWTRKGSVKISGEYKPGQPEPPYGNIRANVFTLTSRGRDQVTMNLKKGPWLIKFTINKEAVSPDLWADLMQSLFTRQQVGKER